MRLVQLVAHIPPPAPTKRGRGRPPEYPDRLFLQALVIMIVRRVPTVQGFLQILAEETEEMQHLRQTLQEHGAFPCRRTWERRLQALPATLPERIACLGRHLVRLIQPWQHEGRAAGIDSTALRALGGVWHKKDREAGKVPHSSIDVEASWSKSGWHGWWYGWKRHIVGVVCSFGRWRRD